jgi:hypothetical protein
MTGMAGCSMRVVCMHAYVSFPSSVWVLEGLMCHGSRACRHMMLVTCWFQGVFVWNGRCEQEAGADEGGFD